MSEILAFLSDKKILDSFTIGLLGVMGVIVERIFIFLRAYLKNIIFAHQYFTIAGIWLANFPSYIEGKHNLELVRISHNQENIRAYIEQYSNNRINVYKFDCCGVFRGNKMSAAYYPLDKSVLLHGVFTLRAISTRTGEVALTGKYNEFQSTEEGEPLRDGNYTLKKIKLPLIESIKMKFHKQSFKSYDDLKAYLSKNKYDI